MSNMNSLAALPLKSPGIKIVPDEIEARITSASYPNCVLLPQILTHGTIEQ